MRTTHEGWLARLSVLVVVTLTGLVPASGAGPEWFRRAYPGDGTEYAVTNRSFENLVGAGTGFGSLPPHTAAWLAGLPGIAAARGAAGQEPLRFVDLAGGSELALVNELARFPHLRAVGIDGGIRPGVRHGVVGDIRDPSVVGPAIRSLGGRADFAYSGWGPFFYGSAPGNLAAIMEVARGILRPGGVLVVGPTPSGRIDGPADVTLFEVIHEASYSGEQLAFFGGLLRRSEGFVHLRRRSDLADVWHEVRARAHRTLVGVRSSIVPGMRHRTRYPGTWQMRDRVRRGMSAGQTRREVMNEYRTRLGRPAR